MIHLFCQCSDYHDRFDSFLDDWESSQLFSGEILIAQGDRILAQRSFGMMNFRNRTPISPNSVYRIGSISKLFTAEIVQQLHTEGRIRFSDSLAQFFTDAELPGFENITIRHLLNHTSGMISHLPDELEVKLERKPHTLQMLADYALNAPLAFQPGTSFQYSNYGYAVLGRICELVTDSTMNDLLQARIIQPFDLNQTQRGDRPSLCVQGYEYDLLEGYVESDSIDLSYASGYGDMVSSCRDLLRFTDALVNKNYDDFYQTASPSSVTLHGWFSRTTELPGIDRKNMVLEHSGSINGFGAHVLHVPADDVTIVVLKNFRSNNYLQPIYASSIANQALEIYYSGESKRVKRSIALDLGLAIGWGTQNLDSAYAAITSMLGPSLLIAEDELNKLGIELLFKYEDPYKAAQVFHLNLQNYPRSYNVYDSYAYALLQLGDTLRALEAFHEGFDVYLKFPDQNIKPSMKQNYESAQELVGDLEVVTP